MVVEDGLNLTMGKQPKEFIRTGTLAELAGLNLQTIRYYERVGLLPKPKRTESGYRQYTQDDLDLLIFIKNAKELGFSLEKIKKLIKLKDDTKAKGKSVKALVEVEINEIEAKMDSLKILKRYLANLNSTCSGEMPVSSCPIIDSLKKRKKSSKKKTKSK